MKLLIYGINYWPELTGVGKYTGEMAEWLSTKGHEVRVITAPPYYPQWRVTKGYSPWRYTHERRAGISIFRCPLWVPTKLRARHRIGHLLSFALSSAPVILWQALRWRPNLIIVIQPPLLAAPMAYAASRLSGAKIWMHIQDFELDAAFTLGIIGQPRLQSISRAVEHFLLQRMDCVSTVSGRMLEHLTSKRIKSEGQVLFTNWVDTEAIYPMHHHNAFRAELRLRPGDIVVLYSGNMGRKQGLTMLLESARALKVKGQTHVKIILAGDGSMRDTLVSMAKNLPNVYFLSLQPVERLNDLLNLADIHVLLQRPEASDFAMPSKLTGMLASGRPIIATALPEMELAKALSGCGVIVPPNDAEALANAIMNLAQNAETRRQLGERAREIAVEQWEKTIVLENFENQITKYGRKNTHASFVAS